MKIKIKIIFKVKTKKKIVMNVKQHTEKRAKNY
jgi:hypothetical protein